MFGSRLRVAAFAAVGLVLSLPMAHAQDFFVPSQQRAAQPARPAPRSQPVQPRQAAPSPDESQAQQAATDDQPPVQFAMPPVPELPALPKGTNPPTPLIGVIGVPDVMRASTAAQQIDRVIGERREKVNQDAQKEQAAWRDMQQALGAQRTTMSPDQIRAKERELQDRITSAQRLFRERNRVIQESAQVALNQIQATLIAVIRQVAESRNMNLVLHRQQVALNVNEFDITDAVTEQLNRLLPSVTIPADGVAPTAQLPVTLAPTPASAPAAPARAPAPAPATKK
jgi:Skp family chaperone for outer membrane proteins